MAKEPYPKRVKIAGIIVFIVFIISIITFRFVENYSWLDSFYFLVVTISTVGFGDIKPENEITKIVLIFLIITGISTIALSSEAIINGIVSRSKIDLQLNYDLELDNHIIIIGDNQVSEKIALLSRERGFEVIIISNDNDVVMKKRDSGFSAYIANYDSLIILNHLNLDGAAALYLFMESDNSTIQAALLAREASKDIIIYAHTSTKLTIDLGELVGITRTYQKERLLGSSFTFFSSVLDTLVIPGQDSFDSSIKLLLMRYSYFKNLSDPELLVFGYVSVDFNEAIIVNSTDDLVDLDEDTLIMLASTSSTDHYKINSSQPELKFRKIWLCGITESNIDTTNYMGFDNSLINLLSFDQKLVSEAIDEGYNATYIDRKAISKFINDNFDNDDLILNIFDEMTDALLMNMEIRRSGLTTRIIQSTVYPNEEKIFRNSGADRINNPGSSMARGMFLILLKELKIPVSFITDTSHIFEYVIKEDDRYRNPRFIEEDGFNVIAIKPVDSPILRRYLDHEHLHVGDSILLFSNYMN